MGFPLARHLNVNSGQAGRFGGALIKKAGPQVKRLVFGINQ